MRTVGNGARVYALLLAVVVCVAARPAAADVVVVVSARSPIMKLSDNEIADIFLGKLTRLPDGTPTTPLDQTEGSAAREAFYLRFTGKSPAQVKAFWSKIIFTGRGRPPRALASDADVMRALHENPSAIGYMDRSSIDANARVLR